MPFVDSKITVKLDDKQKETIKSELGKAITVLHKSETYLMVGFEDGYELYLGGKKLDMGAFVSVSLFGNATSSDYERFTAEVCRILKEVAHIPSDCVYVTYAGIKDWGWNGFNF